MRPDWHEIHRVLQPGGRYLAQHVGPGSAFELIEYFLGPLLREREGRRPDRETAAAEAAGLVVDDLRTARCRMEFHDIGAVVWILRRCAWWVPDFTVERYESRLRELDARLRGGTPFVAHSTRCLIDARRPISPYARFMPDDRKTKPTDASADEVIAAVDDDRRRADADRAFALMREVTGVEPVVWGPSMIGFGTQPYTTADGKEREWFRVGLAPRKAALTLYGLTFYGSNEDLLERLGKHTLGKGCVYVKRMSDIDESVLRELIERSWSADD